MDGLGHGHDLTAWRLTLYSVFRYLNSRYSGPLGRAGSSIAVALQRYAVCRAWVSPWATPAARTSLQRPFNTEEP
jgi:hypothetical protein